MCQLLSSHLRTTIITLVMWTSRVVDHCLRVIDECQRCTGCTTSVPPVLQRAGTPTSPVFVVLFSKKRQVYRVYHRICVSFRNGPWTVVIESWYKSIINRYKWYTCHETLLTRGLQVYHLLFLRGTPKRGSVNKSIT